MKSRRYPEGFLRRFTLLLLIAMGLEARANIDAKYRVVPRNSVLCASLLNSVRASSGDTPKAEIERTFRDFREQTLKVSPQLDAQARGAVVTDSRAGNARQLGPRVYGVERSFQAADDGDHFVIAAAQLEGPEAIDRFLTLTDTFRDQYYQEAETAGRKWFWQDGFGFINMFQYHPIGPILSLNIFAHGLPFPFLTAYYLTHAPLAPEALGAYAFTALITAVGFFDYPVRYARSFQFGFERLRGAWKNFKKRGPEWLYWSRDVYVSEEFLEEMLAANPIRWESTLKPEDRRELTSGIYSVQRELERRRLQKNNRRYSIDALITSSGEGPRMSLVLRSRPPARKATVSEAARDLGLNHGLQPQH